MKTTNKSKYIISLLFYTFVIGCSDKEDIINIISEPISSEGVFATASDFKIDDEIATRTHISPSNEGMSFAWKEGDKIGIYATTMACFNLEEIGTDAKVAKFNDKDYKLAAGSTFYAFYPYDGNSTDKTSIKISYSDQVQYTNDNSSHLGNYDYMVAQTTATDDGNATFSFSHIGTIVRIRIKVPYEGIYKKLSISIPSENFITEGIVDITKIPVKITPVQVSNTISLTLGDGFSIQKDNLLLTAYLFVNPIDLKSENLTIKLISNEGIEYSTIVSGKNLQSSMAYGFKSEHTYVDLGVNSLWATCNIGADMAYQSGNYYAWGEIEPKNNYYANWSDYKWNYNGTINYEGNCTTIDKYCFESKWGYNGFVDEKSILENEDDAAYQNWGNMWRMPTAEEQDELVKSCFWSLDLNYRNSGIAGYIVYKAKDEYHKGKRNKEYPNIGAQYSLSDTHIFLPATGKMMDGHIVNPKWGCYWSSSLFTEYSYDGLDLIFEVQEPTSGRDEYFGAKSWVYRRFGETIRPIINN